MRLYTVVYGISRIFAYTFSGEHTTISEYIGTMQAAIESGQRAALASLKFL